ncbi:hypothetical protein [Microbacterium abyssi]|uniref:hypothetical protein n=1 Tax=Microbacterium abyssi TaxID=2782166 RepID=UPI0018873C4F|nr:hypothetical protein [Microbacterium sp. A18JL241]
MNDDDMLAETELAEEELRRLGLGHVQVHAYGGLACLEAPHDEISAITGEPLRAEVLRAVRGAGFDRVAVHLDTE